VVARTQLSVYSVLRFRTVIILFVMSSYIYSVTSFYLFLKFLLTCFTSLGSLRPPKAPFLYEPHVLKGRQDMRTAPPETYK
jgi:hypothetical protein